MNLDINTYEYNPGVSFMSQNLLGTAEITGGYKYLSSQKGNNYYLDISYKGWYPTVSLGAEHFDYIYHSTNGIDTSFRINSNFVYVAIAQPLNLSKGKYYNFLQPSVSFGFQTMDVLPNQYYKSLRYRFYAHHLLRRSTRDLESRWGQKLDFNFYHTPHSDFDYGYLMALETSFYFPGIGRHHSFKIYVAGQKNHFSDYSYNNAIEFPRGYHDVISNEAVCVKTDYRFPIWYPDFSISSLAYIKRIKGGVFYDISNNRNATLEKMNSLGMDLSADVHFLRFIAPIEVGFRVIYLPQTKSTEYNLLFSIDFNGI